MDGRVWAGHNIISFDNTVLRLEYAQSNRKRSTAPVAEPKPTQVLDTLRIFREWRTQGYTWMLPGNDKLASYADYYGMPSERHTALDDAVLCFEVLERALAVLFVYATSENTTGGKQIIVLVLEGRRFAVQQEFTCALPESPDMLDTNGEAMADLLRTWRSSPWLGLTKDNVAEVATAMGVEQSEKLWVVLPSEAEAVLTSHVLDGFNRDPVTTVKRRRSDVEPAAETPGGFLSNVLMSVMARGQLLRLASGTS